MLELKVTGNDLTEIKKNLMDLVVLFEDKTEPAPSPVVKPKKKTKKKKKEEEVEVEVKKEVEVEVEAEVNPSDRVLDALQKVNSVLGLSTAKELLNEFDANRFSDIKPEDFEDFVARCEEKLNEA